MVMNLNSDEHINMKKTLVLSTLILTFISVTFAQSDCKYNGDYNAILSAVKSKNPTSGKDKLTEDHLKSIAKYWELDCKCKNGVETIEEANELRREAFNNKGHFTSSFIDSHGNNYHKDMSNFGDLEPPFVPFLASSCLKGSNSTRGMSLESGTNCAPEASRLSELDGQLSAYAGQFFVAYCQCINGVPSEEYADNLVATMKSTHKSFDDFRGATPRLSTQPLTSCKITNTGNTNKQTQSASVAAYSAAPANNIQESLLNTFDPQGYAYYKYSEGIAGQGKMITEGLTNQLNEYSNLIESSDPYELLNDFQSKMQNIENLEQNYIDQSFSFGQQRGAELGEQINSGDYLGAFTNAINTIGTMADMKKADQQLAAQKEALRKERIQKMSNVFWKAIEANDNMIQNYLKRAAYSESAQDEAYNLAFVENLKCYANSMDANWSSTSTSWLINKCPTPQKSEDASIQNLFIDEDLQKIKIAERKLKLFENTVNTVFLDAAISFAAAAADINPSAKNFFFLGDLYKRKSMMLAYASMLSAKEIDESFFDNDKNQLFQKIKIAAAEELAEAIRQDDTEYLKAFLAAKLDRTLEINNRSLLSETIRLDKPDAVQLILNEYVKDLNSKERNKKIQQTIMLCAVQNSPETIKRFVELGVSIDFEIEGYSPLKIAAEQNSTDAYAMLLRQGAQKSSGLNEENSTVELLVQAERIPIDVATQLDNSLSDKKIAALTTKMVTDLQEKPTYIDVLTNSIKAKAYISTNIDLQNILKQRFTDEVLKKGENSQAHKYISSGLISFKEIPTLKDLQTDKKEIPNFHDQSVSKDFLTNLKLNMHDKVLKTLESKKQYLSTFWFDKLSEYENKSFQSANELKFSNKLLTDEEQRILTSDIIIQGADQINYVKDGKRIIGLEDEEYYLLSNYIKANYAIKNNIPYSKKVNTIIQTNNQLSENILLQSLSPFIEKLKGLNENEINIYNQTNLSAIEVIERDGIDKIYLYCAILIKEPLDLSSLKYLTKSLEDNPKYQSKNIAFLAFENNNENLFKAIDEKFDLNKAPSYKGNDLFSLMLKKNIPIFTNDVYFTDDFKENVNQTNINKILTHIFYSAVYPPLRENLIVQNPDDLKLNGRKKGIVESLDKISAVYDLKTFKSKSGGSLLHYLVDLAVDLRSGKIGALVSGKGENTITNIPIIHNVELYISHSKNGLNINDNIKDDSGNTALDYLSENKDKLGRDKKSQQHWYKQIRDWLKA
jgi:hypothetical protein